MSYYYKCIDPEFALYKKMTSSGFDGIIDVTESCVQLADRGSLKDFMFICRMFSYENKCAVVAGICDEKNYACIVMNSGHFVDYYNSSDRFVMRLLWSLEAFAADDLDPFSQRIENDINKLLYCDEKIND